MSKATELIKKLNEHELIQNSSWDESLPDEIWSNDFENKHQVVAENLDVDKHRWYETSIVVIEFEDGSLMGTRVVSDLFSESMSFEDVDWGMVFFEMEPVTTVTYKIKK